jgi:ribosome-associated protein
MALIPIPNTANLSIVEHELNEKFIHSGGPGGQNVNKVATSVQLRFDVRGSTSLPQNVKSNLEKIAGSKLTRDGVIVLEANRYRTQERNRADARERLFTMIAEAAKPPPPRRRETKPSMRVRKRRLDSKTKRGAIKKLRRGLREED